MGWGGVQWMGGVGGGVRGVMFNKENGNTDLGFLIMYVFVVLFIINRKTFQIKAVMFLRG